MLNLILVHISQLYVISGYTQITYQDHVKLYITPDKWGNHGYSIEFSCLHNITYILLKVIVYINYTIHKYISVYVVMLI